MKCSGVVSSVGVADAFVESFMEMDGDACHAPLQARSAPLLQQLTPSPRKTAPGVVATISLEHLKESMIKILLLFGHNDSQVLSHHMLRSALLGGPSPMRYVTPWPTVLEHVSSLLRYLMYRHQHNKSVLEISLLALVEAKYLIRHGFGSWAVYTVCVRMHPSRVSKRGFTH